MKRAGAHVALALFAVLFLALAETAPFTYDRLLQEDHFVEWLTVTLFGAAAWFALRGAVRHRRPFDGLVGLFCVFVAGEEFSWGQRLLGLTPPQPFLEHNRQQELTLHNFADVFGQPKFVLIGALVGFGLVLPAVAASARGRKLLERIGATAPPLTLVPWFALAVLLLVVYPHPFTGEWVEALSAGLFLIVFMPGPATGALATATAAALAGVLTLVSGTGRAATPEQLACARAETDALVRDLVEGTAATGRLVGSRSVHKRVFTAAREGYVRAEGLVEFAGAVCDGDDDVRDRRRHAIDPWGTAYWIDLDRTREAIVVTVYSFGPNRRRDGRGAAELADTRDDVVSTTRITR